VDVSDVLSIDYNRVNFITAMLQKNKAKSEGKKDMGVE
jgi:hypothetical protein